MAKERRLIIDGFRGYAIICIVALHFLNHFISIYPTDYLFPSWLNKAVWETLYFVFEGKSYTVFALLLGVTYGIQYTRRKARGESFNLSPSLTFAYPFFLLSSTLRFSFAALCTTNFSRF